MAYKRKTKDVYRLIWNGEEIDSFDTMAEAKKMQYEYQLAYHDMVVIRIGREKIEGWKEHLKH